VNGVVPGAMLLDQISPGSSPIPRRRTGKLRPALFSCGRRTTASSLSPKVEADLRASPDRPDVQALPWRAWWGSGAIPSPNARCVSIAVCTARIQRGEFRKFASHDWDRSARHRALLRIRRVCQPDPGPRFDRRTEAALAEVHLIEPSRSASGPEVPGGHLTEAGTANRHQDAEGTVPASGPVTADRWLRSCGGTGSSPTCEGARPETRRDATRRQPVRNTC